MGSEGARGKWEVRGQEERRKKLGRGHREARGALFRQATSKEETGKGAL